MAGFNVAYAEPKGVMNSTIFNATDLNFVPQSYGNASNVVGTMKNVGNGSFSSIRLVTEVFNSANHLIDVVESYPSFTVLDPNETTSFKIPIDANGFDHFVIRVGAENQ